MTHLLAFTLAPITNLIYSHLPGGSFYGFVFSLPDSGAIASALFNVPYAGTVVNELNQLGIT